MSPASRQTVLSIGFVLLAVVLVGCATPYQEYGSRGGYHDFRFEDDRYYIAFLGNGYTSLAETEKLARYRAAQIADREGYSYFRILERNKNNSSYSARVGVGASTGRIFERPITVLIVQYYTSKPPAGDVHTPKEFLS